ncbi:MAG: 50S ribosomal protein L44e [Halobacteriaceae archaeon]
MEMPRRFNTYCPHCDAHQQHEVERVRGGQSSGMNRMDRRQRDRTKVIGNTGRFSKAPAGEKPTKKVNLRYRCSECGKAHLREGWRAGRLELQE